jgi:hypothetical protein
MLRYTREFVVAMLLQALMVTPSGLAWAPAPGGAAHFYTTLRGIHVAGYQGWSPAPATACRVWCLRFQDRDIPGRRPARGRQSTVEGGSEPSIASINVRCIAVIA